MMLKYFKFFSWNIEGWNRNCFNLMNLVDSSSPSLIFLPEPQLVIYLHFSLCLMVNFCFTLTARILSVLRFPWRQERPRGELWQYGRASWTPTSEFFQLPPLLSSPSSSLLLVSCPLLTLRLISPLLAEIQNFCPILLLLMQLCLKF